MSGGSVVTSRGNAGEAGPYQDADEDRRFREKSQADAAIRHGSRTSGGRVLKCRWFHPAGQPISWPSLPNRSAFSMAAAKAVSLLRGTMFCTYAARAQETSAIVGITEEGSP